VAVDEAGVAHAARHLGAGHQHAGVLERFGDGRLERQAGQARRVAQAHQQLEHVALRLGVHAGDTQALPPHWRVDFDADDGALVFDQVHAEAAVQAQRAGDGGRRSRHAVCGCEGGHGGALQS
jgi:hypothetical protein